MIPERAGERGLALVSVLWGISILSLIASTVMTSTLVSRHMERNAWSRIRLETLMDAAVNRAVLALIDSRDSMRWRIDGVPQKFAVEGTEFTIRIEDELGKIDLNASDMGTFQRLFRAVGLQPADADALAARIVDWRTQGAGHQLDGAKEADYRAAGVAYGPRGGAFQSVDELNLVLGMTPEIFAKVEPALTVYSNKTFFEQTVAPREALLTLPGYDEDRVAEILTRRASGPGIKTNLPVAILDPTASLAGRAFTIEVIVVGQNERAKFHEIVRLTGDSGRPYLVLGY